MREIKFRAWDTKAGVMLTMPLGTNFGISRFFGFLPDDAIRMQFTGLKDKNGKEIYEGDIVSNPIYFDEVREICFNKIGTVSTIQDGSQHCLDLLMLVYIEVIGNVHTHPDLLKGESQ